MSNPLNRYEYVLGTKCQRLLWYRTHTKSEGPSEKKLSDIQDKIIQEDFFESFGDVTVITEDDTYMAMAKTADATYKKKKNVAYGAYVKGPVSCRPDLLVKNDDGTYDLYVIKALTYLRQTVCHDASYQIFVLAGCGIAVKDVYFVHVNPNYIHEKTKLSNKYVKEIITKRVKSLISSVEKRTIKAIKTTRAQNCPKLDIRATCFNPFECEEMERCFSELPSKNVFDISGVDKAAKIDLYNDGLVTLEDIQDSPLIGSEQQEWIAMYLDDEEPIANKPMLRNFIDTIHYPLCFLDFECMQLSIPIYSNTKPYEQIAFQFSLHIVNNRGDKPIYKGYISKPKKDPRYDIAKKLAKDIPDNACIVAYGAQLEKKIVLELANLYPEFSKKLTKIHDSIVDLEIPIEKKYYFNPKTLGANSLKAVTKALYPEDEETSYTSLNGVHNGKEAATSYAMLTYDKNNSLNTNKILKELEEYCSLDTLNLIKIIDKFYEVLENE